MMIMDELTLTWHIVLRLQGHVTVKKESLDQIDFVVGDVKKFENYHIGAECELPI